VRPEVVDRAERGGRRRLVEEAPRGDERRQRVARQRGRLGLLRQFFAGRVERDRNVQIRHLRQAEQPLQMDLSWRRRQQVRAAHDVRHLLRRVVDDDGELVREEAIRAPHDEVADVAREVLRLRSLQPVDEFDARRAGTHAPRALPAARRGRRDPGAARAGIHALAAGSDRRGLEVAARARARVREVRGDERVEGGGIERSAHRLALERTVEGEAVARERGDDVRLAVAPRARHVDVLDAEQPFAAVRARVGETREGRDQRAEMQRSRGGGREAAAVHRQRCRAPLVVRTVGAAGSAR